MDMLYEMLSGGCIEVVHAIIGDFGRMGPDQTCKLALEDPNAEHDIYGCPGVSDNEINKVLNSGPIRKNAIQVQD